MIVVQMDEDDVHVIMRRADKDRDGKVSLTDFRLFMAELLQPQHEPKGV